MSTSYSFVYVRVRMSSLFGVFLRVFLRGVFEGTLCARVVLKGKGCKGHGV